MKSYELEQGPPATPVAGIGGALFDRDYGTLAEASRRVLVQLLNGPSLDEGRHPVLWPVLIADENVIRSRLSDLFLDLVIDTDERVAFTRQAVATFEYPRLLRRVPLSLLDSVLVLHLRKQLAQAQARRERCVVARTELEQHLSLYERAENTDAAGFAKRMNRAIEKMIAHSLIHKIRGSDERYEISATLKLLFPAEEVAALSAQYQLLIEAGVKVATPNEAEEHGEES